MLTSTSLQSCLNLQSIQHHMVAPMILAPHKWSLRGGAIREARILTHLHRSQSATQHSIIASLSEQSIVHSTNPFKETQARYLFKTAPLVIATYLSVFQTNCKVQAVSCARSSQHRLGNRSDHPQVRAELVALLAVLFVIDIKVKVEHDSSSLSLQTTTTNGPYVPHWWCDEKYFRDRTRELLRINLSEYWSRGKLCTLAGQLQT